VTSVRAPAEFWIEAPEAEGLLDTWLVSEGDTVEAGQVLAHVVVVKTTFDLVAPSAGTVIGIAVPESATFGRGAELVTIDDA
jgi:pyruvate/2-oxoglutarate dehydrogenase complex dihydrolipoamide acyltransferase (E2) component